MNVPLIKSIIKNNDTFPFSWQFGNSDTNVIVEHKKLNVKLLRYLISTSAGDVLYDGLSIRESPNNTVIVIRNQAGEIGFVWEWRPIPAKWFWACVRGFSDPEDEDNLATAKREMIEEIGHCQVRSSKKIGVLYQNTTYFENPVGLVLLDVDVMNQKVSAEEGIVDFKFFKKAEILEMIRNDNIEDTFTLSALMRFFAFDGVENTKR